STSTSNPASAGSFAFSRSRENKHNRKANTLPAAQPRTSQSPHSTFKWFRGTQLAARTAPADQLAKVKPAIPIAHARGSPPSKRTSIRVEAIVRPKKYGAKLYRYTISTWHSFTRDLNLRASSSLPTIAP